jgi:hypothetical protein
MSSNYLTFGQFNNNEPQYQQNNYNMEESYNNDQYPPPSSPPKPQFSMPIRQHMPVYQRDREPYEQPSYPNVHLNPTSLMPYIPQTPPSHQYQQQPPSMYPSNSTPIKEAFSENTPPPTTERPPIMSSCIDVNDHIMACPICSKYYQNYTSVYIGIIILLGFIILIFLLKSILEVKRS